MKTFVISAVTYNKEYQINILNNILNTILDNFSNFRVIVMTSKKGTVKDKRVIEYEFPNFEKNWIYPIFLYYFGFRKLSKKLNADIWLSMDSVTPWVVTKNQYSYFQNPSPFWHGSIKIIKYDFKFYLYTKVYSFFIRFLSKRLKAAIVQTDWMRNSFIKKFNINPVIVAAIVPHELENIPSTNKIKQRKINIKNFIYPSFGYVYKNFEILGECAKILDEDTIWNGKIIFTININENKYSKSFYEKYKKYNSLLFMGYQSQEGIQKLYETADALIFPSLIETWGMPLSEAKKFNLPIIASDLNYAHETIGNYHSVYFFDPYNAKNLASMLTKCNQGINIFSSTSYPAPSPPFAKTFKELLNIMMRNST